MNARWPSLLMIGALLVGSATANAQPCPGAGDLEVAIEPTAMTITGATPDGEVLIYGVQRARYAGAVTLLRRTQIVELADTNGDLSYIEEHDFAGSASWLVIDLASGRSQMVRPSGKLFADFDEDSPDPTATAAGATELGDFNGRNVDVVALQDGAIGSLLLADTSAEDMEPMERRVTASLSDLVVMPGRSGNVRSTSAAGDQYFVIDSRQRMAWHSCVEDPAASGTPVNNSRGRELVGGAQ